MSIDRRAEADKELVAYIRELNDMDPPAFALTEDLSHWAGYGIFTKERLGDYLDSCVRHEMENNEYDDGDVYDLDPIEPTWDAVSRHDMNEGW
jgi:hypothetical protein